MKSLSRNVAIAIFIAFAIGSIYGCAEKPITFAGPGVQIWKLNITSGEEYRIKDQTLLLKPSKTEKDVFHVTATIDAEASGLFGKYQLLLEWKGEIRNSTMICGISGFSEPVSGAEPGSRYYGKAKGTFSKRRASGTFNWSYGGSSRQGKWTAERIS